MLIIFVWLGTVLTGNAQVTSEQPEKEKIASTTDFALANNYFGLNLLNKLSEENERNPSPANLFISPYSISLAMAMLHQGTDGSTARQLEASLGYQFANLDGANKSALTQKIKQSDNTVLVGISLANNSYVLSSGNALIVNKQFPVLDSYSANLRNNFRAQLFRVDFEKDANAATDLINQYVSNETNGKIEKLLEEPLAASTQLALVNAVYFKGNWKYPFDTRKTFAGTFHSRNGLNNDKVQFMTTQGRYRQARLNEINATLVELPYEGEKLSLWAILPDDTNSDLKLVEQKLTPTFIDTSIGQSRARSAILTFPKFELKTSNDLIAPLKNLGITEVFEANKANFGALAGDAKLVIDLVKHSAKIEVNEKGSEASAATIISSSRSSFQPALVFNHPFLFFIQHNENGQILFIGEVNRL